MNADNDIHFINVNVNLQTDEGDNQMNVCLTNKPTAVKIS